MPGIPDSPGRIWVTARFPVGSGPAGPPGPVRYLVIDHPGRRNALTVAMWRALPGVVAGLAADPAVGVIVLTGSGEHFCSGADITELPDAPAEFEALHLAAERALADCPKPTVAAIRGVCRGGGCELAVACDLRVAGDTATFGIPAARLGLVYPAEPIRRLAELVGPARTRRMLYTADTFDAGWALTAGLVDEVVPDGEVLAGAAALAGRIAANSPATVRAAKAAIADPASFDAGPWHRQAATSGDYDEGRRAFRERRAPRFTRDTGPLAAGPAGAGSGP